MVFLHIINVKIGFIIGRLTSSNDVLINKFVFICVYLPCSYDFHSYICSLSLVFVIIDGINSNHYH